MPALSKLDAFLNGVPGADNERRANGHKIESADEVTHTGFMGGKWRILDDDLDEFYKLYCEHIRNHGPHHLTERSTKIGQLRVDLDFKYTGRQENHLHTAENITAFVKAYMIEVKKLIDVPENVEIFILEKAEPVFDPIKNVSRSGIHLQVPELKTNKFVEEEVRRNLVKRMGEFFSNLPLADGWDEVYDKSVLTHTKQWTLLGSKKKDGLPYQIKYIIDWDRDTGDVSIDESVPQLITPDLVKKLSVRSYPEDETPMTDYAKKDLRMGERGRQSDDTALLSGGRAVSAPRGRPAARHDPGSRASSPGRIYSAPLTEDAVKYYTAHVMNLADHRYKSYEEWISVGQCLKNIHIDLDNLWLEFSAQDPAAYNPREAIAKWNSFGFRTDGPKLSIASLRKWSQEDNHDRFLEIEKTNVFRLIEEAAASSTEYDVAQVVYAKYRDEFKCVGYGNNVWFQYIGHIWKETDKGINLQCRLSSAIMKDFLSMEVQKAQQLQQLDPCEHKVNEKADGCDYCRISSEKKCYAGMCNKLKTSRFKECVMKECRELFLDTEFVNKVDANKSLIAFNNGVFDMTGNEPVFRDGTPEDYISFSTKLDFDHAKRHDQYECWSELDKFIRDVLPDPEMRFYFLRHLSTCLNGRNDAQKFHILTGNGSNGKSMLMNLMAAAMGDYSCKVSIALITQKRAASNTASPDLIRLKGRRFVTMQEPDEKVPINTGLMKELSSCEKIVARDLYAGSKSMLEYDVQAQFHLACNEKPKINTADGGTWRRLAVIGFTTKFVVDPKETNEKPLDPTITRKVESNEWATAFAAYLIHLYKEGGGWPKLPAPEKVLEYTKDYKEENDVVAKFISERLEKAGGVDAQVVTRERLITAFKTWKQENDLYQGTAQDLTKRVEEVFKQPYQLRSGWTSFRIV